MAKKTSYDIVRSREIEGPTRADARDATRQGDPIDNEFPVTEGELVHRPGLGQTSHSGSSESMGAGTDPHLEEAIRLRAYHLWEQAGRPDGQHEAHWQQAAAELDMQRGHHAQKKPVIYGGSYDGYSG